MGVAVGLTETVSLGNGFVGVRGSRGGAPGAGPGTFVNGFHETWDHDAEGAHALAKTGQTI